METKVKQYTLNKKETNNKAAKFHYTITDEEGNIVAERKSNLDYVAATANGKYFFGRYDLIGKGDHGKETKAIEKRGLTPSPVIVLS